MLLTTLLMATSIGVTAADYFPLVLGRKATYEEKSVLQSVTTDVVGETIDFREKKAIKVSTMQNGKEISTAFYSVDSDAVYLIAYSATDPLPLAMPLFKLGEKKTTWEFEGATSSAKLAEGMSVKGESQLMPAREIMGKKVEVLDVKITAIVGGGAAREIVEQRATYAKGIGLVEMKSKTTVGKKSVESTLKLVKVENPGGS